MEKIIFNTQEFSEINLKRCDEGFDAKFKPLLYFAAGLAEECGEIIGAIKKLERGFNIREFHKTIEKAIKKIEKDHSYNSTEKEVIIETHKKYSYNVPNHKEVVKTIWVNDKMKDLQDECADLYCYLDLICSKSKIDLFKGVKNKFNLVSDEMGLPHKI